MTWCCDEGKDRQGEAIAMMSTSQSSQFVVLGKTMRGSESAQGRAELCQRQQQEVAGLNSRSGVMRCNAMCRREGGN